MFSDLQTNEAGNWIAWDGGVMAMAATGSFNGGTLTLQWAGDQNDAPINIGSLTAPGAIDTTAQYPPGGFVRLSLVGATAPSIHVAWGRSEHPNNTFNP